MAYVTIYYHRAPGRVGAHVRYIAGRPGSSGLHCLGQAFRELHGDVDACVRLLGEHAALARTQAGGDTREGPFVRLLFTLPTDLAGRVSQVGQRHADGDRLVLRDAIEATFRSAGRNLQGVYAIHFHAARRAVHGHVHVDLSAIDSRGRTTFITAEQRARLRGGWEREVVKAVDRAERRLAGALERVPERAAVPAVERATVAPVGAGGLPRTSPRNEVGRETGTAGTTVAAGTPGATRPDRRRVRPVPSVGARLPRTRVRYVPFLAGRLFGWSRTPLVDLFLRALLGRAERRTRERRPALAVRFALGLPVPRVTIRATTPFIRQVFLRLPFLP